MKRPRLPRLRVPRALKIDRATFVTAGGLGWLSAAAWNWHETAGMATVGAALLILSWVLEDN